MKFLCIAASAAFILSTLDAHAELTGGDRARFLAEFNRSCAVYARSDERLSSVNRSALIQLCRCAGPRVADEIDFDQVFLRSDTASEKAMASLAEVSETIKDELTRCLERRGGFMPGMNVTPNH